MSALAQHVRGALPAARSGELPQAPTQAGAVLRRFCRERGIALPHRASPAAATRPRAWPRRCGWRRHTRVPRTIVLITDLDGVVDYEPLRAAARLLTRRGHSLHVLVPHAEALARPEPQRRRRARPARDLRARRAAPLARGEPSSEAGGRRAGGQAWSLRRAAPRPSAAPRAHADRMNEVPDWEDPRRVLARHGLAPKRGFSQNFLGGAQRRRAHRRGALQLGRASPWSSSGPGSAR